MKRGLTAVAMFVVLLAATSLAAQDVTYDYDRGFDFSTAKTYAWVSGTPINDDLINKRIIAAIDTQMAEKGLVKAADGSPADLNIAYHATFDEAAEITGTSSGGWRYGRGMTTTTARVEKVLVGHLILDILNPATKEIVWRGLATKEVNLKADPDKRDKNINKAAKKLLKNFPPKK